MPSRVDPKYLLIGEILRPHGIRGEVRMRILTDYPERIPDLDAVYLDQRADATDPETYHVQHMRMHKDYGLLKLKHIHDRNDADRLRGLYVMVRIEDAVPLEDDEVYAHQLTGLTVRTEHNVHLGEISDIMETGANDVYVISGGPLGEILFPVTHETVIETNVEDGFVIVRPPEGLIPGLDE